MTQKLRSRGQAGFTLIELLVVIIILGILSAVVVFAVRGVGDKSNTAAIAIDKRTIRTALEAYCAEHDKYPEGTGDVAMDELVTGKFLSSRSTYHELNKAGSPRNEGNCNGLRYRLDEIPPGSAEPEQPDVCTEPPITLWSCVAAPAGDAAMAWNNWVAPLKLVNDKYLTGEGTPSPPYSPQLYDPVGDPATGKGQWTQIASPSTRGGLANMMALGPEPSTRCDPNCNKVLVHVDHPYPEPNWYVYDPLAPAGSEWATAPLNFRRFSNGGAQMAKIGGSEAQCAAHAHCGKVLVVSGGSTYERSTTPQVGTPPIAELYDPSSNTAALGATYPPGTVDNGWNLTPLNDGTVLMVGYSSAHVFDPKVGDVGAFRAVASPRFSPHYFNGYGDEAILLDDGRVLVTANAGDELDPENPVGRAEIFDPAVVPIGSWTEVPICRPANENLSPEHRCHLLAKLADGRVLAAFSRVGPSSTEPFSGATFLLDPTATTPAWTDAGEVRNLATLRNDGRRTTPRGVVLTAPGCGALCDKVLMAGKQSAEVFTPPTP